MKVSESKYKNQIGEYFNYSMDWDFLDIVANVLERIDFDADDIYEEIYSSIDEELIYISDQWTLIEHYCLPMDASLEQAFSDFQDDMCSLVSKIKGE